MKSLEARLLERVDVTVNCWLWRGTKSYNGYGKIRDNYKSKYVHRVAYELWVGPIQDGYELDHLCEVKLCVNPEHLDAVPIAGRENSVRYQANKMAKKTHCRNGHPWIEENIYASPKGVRYCRICHREYYQPK